jgi:hypothetical protein
MYYVRPVVVDGDRIGMEVDGWMNTCLMPRAASRDDGRTTEDGVDHSMVHCCQCWR